MLLEHLERRAKAKDVTLGELREGAELALRTEEVARAQALLERAGKLGDAQLDAAAKSWVHARLADCRRKSGDMRGAIEQLDLALQHAEGDAVETLGRKLAELAAGPNGDLEVAASAYSRLLEADPTDPSLWQPLLDVYRRLNDRARFEGFAAQCLRDLLAPSDRAAVHMAHAKFLIEVGRDQRAAVTPLKALLEDSPGHAEGTDLLTQIFQQQGMNEELAELLQTHFDRARDEQNLHAIAELALRIGELYGERRPQAALDTYRSALQWVPDHRGLLHALLERIGPEAEARERAEVMQSLLKAESRRGSGAARAAARADVERAGTRPTWRKKRSSSACARPPTTADCATSSRRSTPSARCGASWPACSSARPSASARPPNRSAV